MLGRLFLDKPNLEDQEKFTRLSETWKGPSITMQENRRRGEQGIGEQRSRGAGEQGRRGMGAGEQGRQRNRQRPNVKLADTIRS